MIINLKTTFIEFVCVTQLNNELSPQNMKSFNCLRICLVSDKASSMLQKCVCNNNKEEQLKNNYSSLFLFHFFNLVQQKATIADNSPKIFPTISYNKSWNTHGDIWVERTRNIWVIKNMHNIQCDVSLFFSGGWNYDINIMLHYGGGFFDPALPWIMSLILCSTYAIMLFTGRSTKTWINK